MRGHTSGFGIRLMSYRHPVVESAAAVEGNQESDTVRSRLWRRLGSGGEVEGMGPPRGSLGQASTSVRAKDLGSIERFLLLLPQEMLPQKW